MVGEDSCPYIVVSLACPLTKKNSRARCSINKSVNSLSRVEAGFRQRSFCLLNLVNLTSEDGSLPCGHAASNAS